MGNEENKTESVDEKIDLEDKETINAEDKKTAEKSKTEESKKDKKSSVKKKYTAEEYSKLEQELGESKEQYLRLRAEYDNFRKRTQAEKTMIYNNAISDAVKAILPAVDNIERALGQENSSAGDMKKGVQMISNQFNSSLEELGVTEIGKIGDPFDPNMHNAVSHIEDEALGAGVISQVLQKGFAIGDRVIRHAMVQVAN